MRQKLYYCGHTDYKIDPMLAEQRGSNGHAAYINGVVVAWVVARQPTSAAAKENG